MSKAIFQGLYTIIVSSPLWATMPRAQKIDTIDLAMRLSEGEIYHPFAKDLIEYFMSDSRSDDQNWLENLVAESRPMLEDFLKAQIENLADIEASRSADKEYQKQQREYNLAMNQAQLELIENARGGNTEICINNYYTNHQPTMDGSPVSVDHNIDDKSIIVMQPAGVDHESFAREVGELLEPLVQRGFSIVHQSRTAYDSIINRLDLLESVLDFDEEGEKEPPIILDDEDESDPVRVEPQITLE